MKLSPKQERFCQEYIIDLNATQAAIRAGYSKNSAGEIGHENLKKPQIESRISELKAVREKRTEINQDMVVMEIANVAFANIGLVCNWDDEGHITLKAKDDMCEKGLASLKTLESIDSFDKDGNKLSTRNRFSMNDKLKALELLSKHLGMLDGSGADKNNTESTLGRLQNALSNLGRGKGSK